MEEGHYRKMIRGVHDLDVEVLEQPLVHGANEYGGAHVWRSVL